MSALGGDPDEVMRCTGEIEIGKIAAREMVVAMMMVKKKERSEVESWFSLVHASWTNRRIVAPLQKTPCVVPCR
jgi:hypothetical protein